MNAFTLYSSPASPFGARVLIAARVKGITFECIRATAELLRSTEYRALNPVRKIPLLITHDGNAIPESESILHYIEDRFPRPSLLPRDPDQRARINVAVRIMDIYVMAPVIRLFSQLEPATRDAKIVSEEVSRWKDGLTALAHFMDSPLPRAEAELSLADCVLPPSLHLSSRIARLLGHSEDFLRPHPSLGEYYSRMEVHPLVGPILEAMTAAQAVRDANHTQKH